MKYIYYISLFVAIFNTILFLINPLVGYMGMSFTGFIHFTMLFCIRVFFWNSLEIKFKKLLIAYLIFSLGIITALFSSDTRFLNEKFIIYLCISGLLGVFFIGITLAIKISRDATGIEDASLLINEKSDK